MPQKRQWPVLREKQLMYFKRIEMHGFKSFAEPVTIEFHEGITCIVGPNGSGKSNISDAVRWVLGEQSPKMLRGGKMEEVIFAGTENRKSRGMAEVTLVLDNSEGELPIDYNEVAITRRMYRSGESEYCINDNQCRLRDIRELIMDTGIGVDGYSLIGQGKISDIVSNKTESRREIFEEAAGIVMYRTKKAEAERKLKSTTDNLDRVNDIVGEIEGRIDGLREDSEKAAEYIELRDRFKELEINITLKNIENLELKSEYIKDDLAEAEQLVRDAKEEKEQLEGELTESREKNEELDRLHSQEKDKLLANVEAINELKGRKQLADERLEFIEQNTRRLESEIAQLEEKARREEDNSKNLFDQKKQMDTESQKLEKALAERIAEYGQLVESSAKTEEKTESLKAKLFGIHGDITRKQAEINSMDALKETLEKRKQQVTSEQSESEGNNKDTLDALNKAKAEAEEAETALSEIQENSEELKSRKSEAAAAEKDMVAALEELNVSEGKLSARKKTIEEMESNYEGYNNAVRFLMKQNLSGIEGVAAELMTVPKGMETAIGTALGGKLQNIVCADDESAKKAIRVLKEKSAGRLTFLPLDSIKSSPLGDETVESAEGFLGYGDECIECDEKYRTVMEYLLGNVAVMDNMDNAVKLFRKGTKGLKLVTLEGEIINAGGAITGGKYKNKTENLLERRAEISELEKQIEQLQKDRKEKTAKLEKAREVISEAETEGNALEESFRETERSLMEKRARITGLEGFLSDLKTSREKWEKEIAEIEDEQKLSDDMTETLRVEIEKLNEEMAGIEAEVNALQANTSGRKEELEGANEKITEARVAAESMENKKAHIDELVARVNASIREFQFEKNAKENELTELKAEKEGLENSYAGIDDSVCEKEELKNNQTAYIEELSAEKEKTLEGIRERTARLSEIERKLTGAQDRKYDLEIKQAKQETQLENYKNKIWEEFEISYIKAIEMKKKDFVMSPAVKESRNIKARMRELGDVNIGAIKEYAEVSERYEFLTGQRDDILESMEELKKIISDMDKVIRERFKKSFDEVVVNFEKIFKDLFGGGHAQLLLEDESDPLESPIEIVAQPPGKALKNINLLSGGEKSMTAIALMFAVLKTKPTPFCILDEVEAALDDVNIERFAKYLTSSFENIQFALVTHKKATMEYADALYGVTMPEKGISKVLSLKLGEEFEGAEK